MPRSVAVITRRRRVAKRKPSCISATVIPSGDVAGEELGPAGEDVRLVTAAAQELEQHLAMARRRRREQRSLALLDTEPAVDAIVGCCDAGGERVRDAGVVVARGRSARHQRQCRPRRDVRAQRVGANERLVRSQDRPLDVASKLLVALVDELPGRVERLERAGDDDEQRVAAQVVEERGRRLEEQRQVVLDAGRQLRVGDGAIDRAASGLDGKVLAEPFAKELDRRLVERKFARRQDFDFVGLACRELRLRVERSQCFDLVVEQVDAHRRRAAGREHVEHGAAHGELTGLGDLLHAQIAMLAQALRHLRGIEPVADGERQRARDDELRRRQPLEQRAGLEDQGLGLAAREPVQREQAVGEQILRRRDGLVRQRLVVGEAP